jgi:ABC-type multidrug transport system ATPase subunit
MNESMLRSLMRLFAIMASINKEAIHVLARNFVESYLTRQFSQKLAERFLLIFEEYFNELDREEKKGLEKKISVLSVKILYICTRINEELHIRHRFQILLSLIQFAKYFEDYSQVRSGFSNAITDAVETIADGLLITAEEYANCTSFIVDKFYKVPNKERLLVISDDKDFQFTEIKHYPKDGLLGQIFVLRILRADTYLFQYAGKERLELNGKYIFPRHVYFMPRGSSIKGEGITPIYYSDVVAGYLKDSTGDQVDFLARNIEFHFKNSPNGIHNFSFQGKSGQLVGIMGGSGTGKSTLVKVLNGSLKHDAGSIYINGHNLLTEKKELEGMIGYIPQDDLLIEELTVFQNLYFNAKLCLDGYGEEELTERVNIILTELDLFEVKYLKVGSPLHKFVSGGQRKRLNIALELIREPYILFVDEPTSGLSSTDSENVMMLLKELGMKGKLVVVNIHQPSSDLFKLFDQLIVLDKGGYPVFSGNPVEGIMYFKRLADRVDASESECASCGNTDPDEIFQIIEERDINEFGEFSNTRKTSPVEWYRKYMENIQSTRAFVFEKKAIPASLFKIPDRVRQYGIFFKRNLLSKLADRQFLSISLLVAPLLAVILGYFTKYVSGTDTEPHAYLFSQNENLPAYLFMSVIVALFLGLIISAEEIIKDRKILARESFLHLSRTSYLLSKVAFLFLLSAIQMFLFVIIGNAILEIRGMTFSYWVILFTTACFANVLGLNISDGLKSVVAIYIVVPFLLVPQILLAGVIVKFDKLHYKFASHESVPFVADLMPSRWVYEALAVNQFVNNSYQQHFYDVEMSESNVTYDLQFLVPTLIQQIEDAETFYQRGDERLRDKLSVVRSGFDAIYLTDAFPGQDRFTMESFNPMLADSTISWLWAYRSRLSSNREKLVKEKDRIYMDLKGHYDGNSGIINFKRDYYNESLADLVLNRVDLHKIVEIDNKLIRKMEPGYMYPVMKNGRSHFFASVKRLRNLYMPTVVFNIAAVWTMCLVFYGFLQFSLLRRTLEFFGAVRRRNIHANGN